mgnify:CR=1 FL=1
MSRPLGYSAVTMNFGAHIWAETVARNLAVVLPGMCSVLRHPHVIQFKEVFLTSEYIAIAMEYATGGSLFHYVQKQTRLKEAVARWFFQQLIIGVDYCHKRGVANRDIKLENTLLQKVNGLPLPLLKICDFGYSKADFKSAAKSKVGTRLFDVGEGAASRWGGGGVPLPGRAAAPHTFSAAILPAQPGIPHLTFHSCSAWTPPHRHRPSRRRHMQPSTHCHLGHPAPLSLSLSLSLSLPPPRPPLSNPQVGTLTYMAPEVLVNRDGKYDGKVRDGGDEAGGGG